MSAQMISITKMLSCYLAMLVFFFSVCVRTTNEYIGFCMCSKVDAARCCVNQPFVSQHAAQQARNHF